MRCTYIISAISRRRTKEQESDKVIVERARRQPRPRRDRVPDGAFNHRNQADPIEDAS